MQIETTTPARMAIIKKSTMNGGESMERKEAAFTIDGNVYWYRHYGEQNGGSLKK